MNVERNSHIDALEKIWRDVRELSRQLDGIVHPDIAKKLEAIYTICEKELKPIHEADEKKNKDNFDILNNIQEENKFKSFWSMDVLASDLDRLTLPISKLTYESWGPTQIKLFDRPTQMTWLEFWKVADKMILDSGDTHHVFIEKLHHNPHDPVGHFHIFCGS